MLYPKRTKNLDAADFKNPASEYRATPFWAWNNALDKDELVWQIEQLKKMGFGGFHMHVRTGLATEYMSDEHMEAVSACVEKARQEKMLAWLYDEDRWPSGAAGGLVTKNPQYRQCYLLLTRKAQTAFGENEKLIACFDVVLHANGELQSYSVINENDKAQGFKLYAYQKFAPPTPWFNNQAYLNTLDAASVREFVRVTHEVYEKRFGKDFGGVIPAIFTDEPQVSMKETLDYAQEEKDVTLPWTMDIEDTYQAAYGGQSLINGLPELFWDLPDGKVSQIRYRYHDHTAERFVSAFADQIGEWCAEHNIMLSGHLMEEASLWSQTRALGDAMRSYRSFQFPGIDMLCDCFEFNTAKQAQSAARQMGVPGTMSELYGVTNYNFDFRRHKIQGDWQAALGVTVRVPHLSWVSMNGEAKRDYPPNFNYQAPWYEEYPYVEDHYARTASALTRGKAVCRVGVIHPIESYWLHWGAKENTAAVRDEMDRKFGQLCDWLLRGLIDFDYICESTLPRYCAINDIRGQSFPVGDMNYDVIIIPALETIRKTTLERLEAFQKAGGRIVFLGDAPKYIDALASDGGKKLRENAQQAHFEQLSVLSVLDDIREIEIRDNSGAMTRDLLYQLREEENGSRWLFIVHADRPGQPDTPHSELIRVKLRGEWAATLYDTISGEITPLPVSLQNGWTVIVRPFWEHDSLLLKLDKSKPASTSLESQIQAANNTLRKKSAFSPDAAFSRFSGPVPVTLEEPNVLLLDMAEYALDNEDYRPREEILRIDDTLRRELQWPLRCNAVAQPWVEHDGSTPHTLKLRYTFASEIPFTGAELALENALSATVTLNGEKAGDAAGFYVDKCIGKRSLPDIKAGTNILEVSIPYGRKVDVEAMYLLGDFGVYAAGSSGTITPPVRSLHFGDITPQGLPFYGGNLIYHLEAETSGDFTIVVTNYRGHLLRIKTDGKDYGPLAYSPYAMEINAGKGRHKIDIKLFGNRINTFGQLHRVVREPHFMWWGPDSWRPRGSGWSYEHQLWPQGIMKSPEIVEM
ncbi:MAG: hypothetical protein FWG89_02945 [Treponema sp.]|nr:hypothetical protein [Treponema sp.]